MKIYSDVCPWTLSVLRSVQFSKSVARGNLSFEEQIMSKDKYPGIFSCQMEAIVFIILQIFFTKNWGILKQLFTEVEVASGGYLPSHEATR